MALLSVKQAAARLGCCAGLVYGLCAAGKIAHSRIGLGRGKIVIAEEDVAAYLAATRKEGGASLPPPAPRPARPGRPKLTHLRLPA